MKWQFVQHPPSLVETEVTQRDQFRNDDIELCDTLVRESIQNSLDAIQSGISKITVSFAWVDGDTGLDKTFVRNLFDGQTKHAKEAGLDLGLVDFDNPSAIVIEDFGTTGLTGPMDSTQDSDFSDFWRRHGKSHKTGKSRGRWGLGKLVFSASSDLGVFFGATEREGDQRTWVMGQTVLNLRTLAGKKFPPHAFFADMLREDPLTRIQIPIEDPGWTEKFTSEFRLNRRGNPGLSVIIPFPSQELEREAMIGIAISNYFYPIVTGQLVVEFGDTVVNDNTIRELAGQYASGSFEDIDALFDFIEGAFCADPAKMLTLKDTWTDDTKLDEDDFNEQDLENIREKFKSGEMIGLNLPVKLKKKNGRVVRSGFFVFIQRPEALNKGLDLYVRGGLTLPGESKFKGRKAFGAMIAEEEVICSFLGDAENAAHTKWISNAEKLRNNYQAPRKVLKVIQNAVVELYDLLANVEEEIDEQALQAFFWTEEPEARKRKRKPTKTPVIIPPIPPRTPPDFNIGSTDDGFTVSTTDTVHPSRFPQTLLVKMAYDVVTGNPFKKYDPLDFTVGVGGNISVDIKAGEGVSIVSRRQNEIRLEIPSPPFKMKASGFDANRDLKVRVTREG